MTQAKPGGGCGTLAPHACASAAGCSPLQSIVVITVAPDRFPFAHDQGVLTFLLDPTRQSPPPLPVGLVRAACAAAVGTGLPLRLGTQLLHRSCFLVGRPARATGCMHPLPRTQRSAPSPWMCSS